MVSDEELYKRTVGGDEGALEALVHRYHSPLLGFLYRQTGDRHLAEDLIQETFARLLTYQGEAPRRFKSWAFAVASNICHDHYRRASSRRELPDALESWGEERVAGSAPPADELLLRDADRQEVVAALQALSPSHREVLVLRFYHEMSMDEIAEVTGAPLGTVKSRNYHALRQMKLYLEGGDQHEKAGSGSRAHR